MPEVPVLDQSVLRELQETTGDDPDFVRDLVETYLADVLVQLEGIDSAIAASDADALVRPAHTLKSSSVTLGALRLGDISRTLEMTGRSGALDATARENADAAHAEWGAVQGALKAWLAEQAKQ
jgi:HPt (histidine-containing phosphotransfer) domain-containing protein